MKKLHVFFLQLLCVLLIAPNAFGNFMVPLESTIESWGKPLTISNDGHRYFFKNQNGDSAVVYTDYSGRVIIDSFSFGPGRYLKSYKLEGILNPRSKGYKWKQVYAPSHVGDVQVVPMPNCITFVSSHGIYVALAYDNGDGRYNKICVFDTRLYDLIAKENYDPFDYYENDIVNEYLNATNSILSSTIEVKKDPRIQDAQKSNNFEPIIEMDGNLFPSYIIGTSGIRKLNEYSNSGKYRGEKNGMIGVRYRNNLPNSNVRLEIRGTNYIRKSAWRGILEDGGESYEIFPTIEYDFELLYENKQPVLETVSFAIYANEELKYESKKRIVIRPINECPFLEISRNGHNRNMSFLFAAYVNEDHPIIDRFLSQAKKLGLEKSFIGYQGNTQKVLQQVYTIWYTLQRSGITYSSITETSLGSEKVFSQNVRFIEESIYNTQANCVDGSVLLASIIKKIGIDPFLVLVPGHCYLGFYGSPNKKDPFLLETTMIGSVELKKAWLNLQSRREVSRKNFNQALGAGSSEFQKHLPKIKEKEKGYFIIDIDDARKAGVMVLKSNV